MTMRVCKHQTGSQQVRGAQEFFIKHISSHLLEFVAQVPDLPFKLVLLHRVLRNKVRQPIREAGVQSGTRVFTAASGVKVHPVSKTLQLSQNTEAHVLTRTSGTHQISGFSAPLVNTNCILLLLLTTS